MQFPAVTAIYAGLLALILVGLSGWVVAGRVRYGALIGEGGNDTLQRRVRAHGNFTEYVPLALLLVSLLEMQHTSRFAIHGLLLALLVARLIHPVGMMAPANSPQQFACRGGGILLTLLVLLIAAVLLLANNV